MLSKSWQARAGSLAKGDVAVLDQLLEVSPEYAMVDDYSAVRRLLERGFIEAGVRKDGDAEQPVYRITARGAEAYARVGAAPPLVRVG